MQNIPSLANSKGLAPPNPRICFLSHKGRDWRVRHRFRKSQTSEIGSKADAGAISPLAGEKVFSCTCEVPLR